MGDVIKKVQASLNVLKSLFDANTVLASDTDNTPTARTIAESRVVGRKVGGNIEALTVDEVLAFLADNTTNDVSTSKHGLVPKAPNDTTKFLRGDATWAAAGGSKPTIIQKTSNTTWNSSGVTITGMSFAAEANKKYLIEIFPTGVSSNLTNGSMEFGAPSGASVYESILIDTSNDVYSTVRFYGKNSPYVLGISTSEGDDLRSDYDKCLVVMGGTAGNIVLKSISNSGTLYPCVMVIQEVE